MVREVSTLALLACVTLTGGCAGGEKPAIFDTKSEMAERRCRESGLAGDAYKQCLLDERRHIERQITDITR